jgi:cytoskeleton protein RodZ
MQSIGERLEEARIKRGNTLAEAAQYTKIRQEYLLALEKNDGKEIPLPPIYIRGYIRNYAKYLRLDSARLLTDYDAQTPQPAKAPSATAQAQKELIGRLELSSEQPPAPTLPTEAAANEPQATIVQDKGKVFKLSAAPLPAWVWPVVIGFIATLLVAGLIVGIASCSKQSPAANAQVAPTQLRLMASGDVTVIVREIASDTTLFAGTLRRGEEKVIERRGSVRVQYSDGNLLETLIDGKRAKIGSSGTGRKVIE